MGQNISALNPAPGGTQNALNVTAAKVVKSAPGTIMRILTVTAGSAGNLVINDNTALGASNVAANEIQSYAFGNAQLAAGQTLDLQFPCKAGITLSAVPTGWVGSVSFF